MRRLQPRGAIRLADASKPGADARPLERSALGRFDASEAGKLLSGAAAFAAMWRVTALLRPAGLLACSSMVLRVLETANPGFLRIRPALQGAVRGIAPS